MPLVTVTNLTTSQISLPGSLGVVAAGKSVSADILQAELEKMSELDTLVAKSYISYKVELAADIPDKREGVVVGTIQTVSLVLTNAQLKALRATPVVLVAAPGVGKVLVPVECTVYYKYGGTNAFTFAGTPGELLGIKRVGGATLLVGGTNTILGGTASTAIRLVSANAASTSVTDSKTLSDNIALEIHNVGDAELAGNAANNNTATVVLSYRVDPVAW